MTFDVYILQHADKIRLPGDHGLTSLGREQASRCGRRLRVHAPFDEVWCSTLRRSRETAELVAGAIGFPRSLIREDDRVVERMNWWSETGQTRDEFRTDWERSTADRDYQPRFGDSSRAAGDRFASFLTELRARLADGRVLVVAHGGVTLDLVRTWFGDDRVCEAVGAFEHGLVACALTLISLDGDRRTLHGLGVPAERLKARH